MRVIGGRDYYDSARAFGIDETLVFVRNNHDATELVEIDGLSIKPQSARLNRNNSFGHRCYHFHASGMRFKNSEHYVYPVYVWFAGKLYRGIHHYVMRAADKKDKHHYIWSREVLQRLLGYLDASISFGERFNSDYFSFSSGKSSIDFIDNWMQATPANSTDMNVLINNKIAIAIHDNGLVTDRRLLNKWKINTDGLKSIDFVKAVDPYQAFQELSMFIGGVLPRPSNPMVEISNETVMLAKHGMDNWSFRRLKHPRKG